MTTRAKQYIRQKSAMPTTARSRMLQQLSPDITERSMFSSGVDKADLLARWQDLSARMVDPSADGPGMKVNKTVFREKARQQLAMMGYDIKPDGGLTDITSTKRLNLVATMITQEAQGYTQFEQANDPAILDAFPAQELFRLQSKKNPRAWLEKWEAAGGTLYGGRMIAMKDDPIWTRRIEAGGFNRFGRPFPPFDFNSGMWIKPVPRGEAVRLGVCGKADVPKQQRRTYNMDLQQSCNPLSTELQKRLNAKFSNRFDIDDKGIVHFLSVAQGVQRMMSSEVPAHLSSSSVFVSPAKETLLTTIRPKLGDLSTDAAINLHATHARHIQEDHKDDPLPITQADWDLLPALLNYSEMELVPPEYQHVKEGVRADIKVKGYNIVVEKAKGSLSIVTFYKTGKK